MPRKSRESLKSKFFHVIIQGIEKKYIFETNKAKEKYKNTLLDKISEYNIKLLAYCIMDNHVHLLVHSENIQDLSKAMQRINISYAFFFNESKQRVGYVFRNRFESIPIENEKHLYTCLAYIHLNPVYANMCEKPHLYKYSSYNDFILKKGVVDNKTLLCLKYNPEKYIDEFKFIHYMRVNGEEYGEILSNKAKEERISEYIKEHDIKDIIFQSEKVKQMIDDLKKEKISFSRIARFLNVNNKRLKEIISE